MPGARQAAGAAYSEGVGVVVAFLRGVNVGGHNQIKMDALRALCERLGLRDARTYLQSGNLLFRGEARDVVPVAKKLEDEIGRCLGRRPGVIVRTCAELKQTVARNPFSARRDINPSRLLVSFLAGDPGPEARAQLLKLNTAPEEVRLGGRELYVYYPNGIGRSKLTSSVLEKALKTPGTARNWNTVTKLVALAEGLEAGP